MVNPNYILAALQDSVCKHPSLAIAEKNVARLLSEQEFRLAERVGHAPFAGMPMRL